MTRAGLALIAAEFDGWEPQLTELEPVFRLVQGYIRVQRSASIAVRQNSFARSKGHERSTAYRIRAGVVARVAVEEERFDERDACVSGLRIREKWAHLRPRAISTHNQV